MVKTQLFCKMKTTNELENREIGELISEITEKGWIGLIVDILPNHDDSPPFACVEATNYALPEESRTIYVEGATLAESLAIIVDTIRRQRGEPTLAEEVTAMICKEEEHESLPPIWTGPEASCRCGSKKPLIVERPVKIQFPWDGSQPIFDPVFSIMGIAGPLCIGEKGRCPDCSAWYQLNT
jgi:hypothetical protein